MALPQDRYIHITSGNGSADTTERSLQTLVITEAATVDSSAFDTSTILKCASAAEVGVKFGTSSKEYLWAVKYFSYVSPTGRMPSRLMFAKHGSAGTGENAFVKDLDRVAAMTNDFAVITFLTNPQPTAADVKLVATANAAYNYRFLYVASMTNASVTGATPSTVAGAKTALVGADGTNGTEITYQRAVTVTGASLAVPKTYIAAAIVSAIDWDAQDGATNAMFRQITGETADVVSESAVVGANASQGADDLDAADVDYYGLVQTNGTEKAFFQRGYNSDGEAIMVYVGELWLKSRISSRLLSMLMSANKVPANAEGNARVYAEIDSVCTDALKNGVIEVGKTLGTTDRMNILSWTADAEAADRVEALGYWLKVWFTPSADGKGYVAKYLLIYSKGDVIVKVDGTDTFV